MSSEEFTSTVAEAIGERLTVDLAVEFEAAALAGPDWTQQPTFHRDAIRQAMAVRVATEYITGWQMRDADDLEDFLGWLDDQPDGFLDDAARVIVRHYVELMNVQGSPLAFVRRLVG